MSGLSLIDVVVAMAVLALIATMGLQSITGTLRLRDGMADRASETDQLIFASALLRNDLSAVVPLGFYPPGDAPLQPGVSHLGEQLGLSVTGQLGTTVDPSEIRFLRAVWTLDPETDVLSRQVWPALSPATASQITDPMPVLTGVTGWRLRSYWPETGWADGLQNPTLTPRFEPAGDSDIPVAVEVYSSTLPLGMEVVLETRAWGEIVLVEALR